jgi:hypothetical protein
MSPGFENSLVGKLDALLEDFSFIGRRLTRQRIFQIIKQ